VLLLLNTRTGSYAEVRPARRGLLRVCAHVAKAATPADLTGLRVLLVADLLARTAELRNLQVQTVLAAEDNPDAGGDPAAEADTVAVEQAADALNIHPPAARASARDAEASLGGPIDVHLASHDVAADHGLAAHIGTASRQDAEGIDPLAIRLALLSFPYYQPADLTKTALAEAEQVLGHWRRRVAEWAQSPSRPMPAHLADRLRSAGDDLDTISMIALLRDLAPDDEQPADDLAPDGDVPPGARFETFLAADRILGLDLPRDIGRAG
jgi:hypothetical protein